VLYRVRPLQIGIFPVYIPHCSQCSALQLCIARFVLLRLIFFLPFFFLVVRHFVFICVVSRARSGQLTSTLLTALKPNRPNHPLCIHTTDPPRWTCASRSANCSLISRDEQMGRCVWWAAALLLLVAATAPQALAQGVASSSTGMAMQSVSTPVVVLKGAGSTLAQSLYQDALSAYRLVEPAVSITYAGVGSGGGRTALRSNTVDFAGSDSFASAAEYTQAPDLFYLPTMAAAVGSSARRLTGHVQLCADRSLTITLTVARCVGMCAVATYNLPEFDADGGPPLLLDQQCLAGVFLGNLSYWNDSRIAVLNPGRSLPYAPITIVVRSDSSGTTGIWTESLSSFSPTFKAVIGQGDTVDWTRPNPRPRTVMASGNNGVGAAVKRRPYSIGYSVQSTADSLGLPYARLLTADGSRVLTATVDAVVYASMELTIGTSLARSTAQSWPIASFTYVYFRANVSSSGQTCEGRRALVRFWSWFYTSPVVNTLAAARGFAIVPNFIQEVLQIHAQLHDRILCAVGAQLVQADPLIAVDQNFSSGLSTAAPLFSLAFSSYQLTANIVFVRPLSYIRAVPSPTVSVLTWCVYLRCAALPHGQYRGRCG
jgi:phosphate transport system substrate-binding protein